MKVRAFYLHQDRLHTLEAALTAACLLACSIHVPAQTAPSGETYQIVQRTMDSRTWARTVTTTDPLTGVVTSQVASYQETIVAATRQIIERPGFMRR